MGNEIFINKNLWNKLIEEACEKVKELPNYKKRGLYGVPRGGVPVALEIGRKLDIEVMDNPDIPDVIIVDDLIDSGRT